MLLAVVIVNEVPGFVAVNMTSPTSLPAVAKTPKVLFALIPEIKLSRTSCGVVFVAFDVKGTPFTTMETVSPRVTVPVTFTLLTWDTAG